MLDPTAMEAGVRALFGRRPAGVVVRLFGRVARGDARAVGDVDLAVLRDIQANRFDDRLAFVLAIRTRLTP